MKLNELSLNELRNLYPNISARSKEDMLNRIAESIEIVEEEIIEYKKEIKPYVEGDEDITWANIKQFVMTECKSNKKILVRTPSSIEADLIWRMINDEVFPKLNAQEVNIMASSTRRDMHLNGTCYIRFCCQAMFDTLKGFIRYTDFKDVV